MLYWLIKLPIQLAGGNSALALAVTVASNLLGILTVSLTSYISLCPLWKYKLIMDHGSWIFPNLYLTDAKQLRPRIAYDHKKSVSMIFLCCWERVSRFQPLKLTWLISYQIPFWVSRYVAGGVGISFPTDQLFRSLIVTLLIPLVIGKVRRSFSLTYLLFLQLCVAKSYMNFSLIGFVVWLVLFLICLQV